MLILPCHWSSHTILFILVKVFPQFLFYASKGYCLSNHDSSLIQFLRNLFPTSCSLYPLLISHSVILLFPLGLYLLLCSQSEETSPLPIEVSNIFLLLPVGVSFLVPSHQFTPLMTLVFSSITTGCTPSLSFFSMVSTVYLVLSNSELYSISQHQPPMSHPYIFPLESFKSSILLLMVFSSLCFISCSSQQSSCFFHKEISPCPCLFTLRKSISSQKTFR